MATIKIEKNIPVAPRQSNGGKRRLYPYPSMQVGDSFIIPDEKWRAVATGARQFGGKKRPKWKFAVRSTPKGYRCWRVG